MIGPGGGAVAASDWLPVARTVLLGALVFGLALSISVSQIGFPRGTQAVAPVSRPPSRSTCGFAHQPTRSLARKIQGLAKRPSVIGVRTCAARSASPA